MSYTDLDAMLDECYDLDDDQIRALIDAHAATDAAAEDNQARTAWATHENGIYLPEVDDSPRPPQAHPAARRLLALKWGR